MLQFPRSRFSPRRRKISDSRFSLLFRNVLAVGLTALLILAPLSFNVSGHQLNSDSKITASENAGLNEQGFRIHGFIIEMGINGETTCRAATAEELPAIMAPKDASREKIKVRASADNSSDIFQEHASTQGDNIGSGGLTINFNVLSQLQADANKDQVIAAFTKAAQYWTNRIKSPVTVDIDIDYGNNRPSGSSFPSGVLGSTGSASVVIDYSGFRRNLIAAASSPAEAALYNSLPASIIPSNTGYGGLVDVNVSTAKALGIPAGTGSAATIAFNKKFTFDFNPDDGIDPNQTDFVAVATHEIGHALGFTSDAGEGELASVTPWDIFRFRPGTAAGNFTNAQRIMSIGGGEQVYFTGQTFTIPGFGTTTELGLSNGGPASGVTTNGADGWQSSHWKADDITGKFIGIMDPSISRGTLEVPTENDYSTLETIGWDLTGNAIIPSPPPPPSPPANDNFASAQVISGCSGSVISINVAATKETGEPNNLDSPTSTKSVWYKWQAPSTGSVTIDTSGSGFDTILSVYTGNSVSGLSLIDHNDDVVPGQDTSSKIQPFTATQGTTYFIQVNGYDNHGTGGDTGAFKLNWNASNCTQAPTLLTEANSSRVIALDSVTFTSGPFHKTENINFSSDHLTRVMLFTSNLGLNPGDDLSVISVQAQGITLPVEAAGIVRDLDQASYIVVRLPSNLPVGDLTLTVSLRGVASNTATISITN